MSDVNAPLNRTPSTAETDDDPAAKRLTTSETEKKKDKSRIQIQEPSAAEKRRDVGGYRVVRVEEKHGPLHSAIPVMPLPVAVVCCLLNLFLPGVGTFISAFTVFCCGSTRVSKPVHAFGLNLASALLQMVTFIIIVGWIWSILWGMTFIQLCLSTEEDRLLAPIPYYARRQSSVE